MADSEYLKKALGSVLAKGVAETCNARPDDPIEFLAQFLLKSVADDESTVVLEGEKEVAAKKADADAQAAELATFKEQEVVEARQLTHDKEEKRLEAVLSGAEVAETVFSAVVSYARARTGANGYVMLTDLPEKLLPPTPPEPAPAAEGEAPAADGEGEAPPEEPPPEPEGEPEEPPPKYAPKTLEYVVSTAPDEALVIGKVLERPPAPPEEGDDTPPPPSGVGEGVTFTAVDDFLAGGAKVYHEPKAVENRSVKFWYLPRIGSYAAAPFEDVNGEVKGVLGFDTLGLERPFSAEDVALIESLAVRTSTELKRIEQTVADEFHVQNDALKAMLPDPAAEPPPPPEEGCDPFDAAKASLELPASMLGSCTPSHFKYVESRRQCPPGVLLTFKGVMALLAPDYAAEMGQLSWPMLKQAASNGDLPWGGDLFEKAVSFDVMNGDGGEGWEVAEAMAAEVEAAPEDGGAPPKDDILAFAAVAHALYLWLAGSVAVHKLKVEKEAAEAAAEGGE